MNPHEQRMQTLGEHLAEDDFDALADAEKDHVLAAARQFSDALGNAEIRCAAFINDAYDVVDVVFQGRAGRVVIKYNLIAKLYQVVRSHDNGERAEWAPRLGDLSGFAAWLLCGNSERI